MNLFVRQYASWVPNIECPTCNNVRPDKDNYLGFDYSVVACGKCPDCARPCRVVYLEVSFVDYTNEEFINYCPMNIPVLAKTTSDMVFTPIAKESAYEELIRKMKEAQ